MNTEIKQAIQIINKGGVIAYPTEGVYGLGCNPFDELAVQRILQLKKRSWKKGLIVIAYQWQQVEYLVSSIAKAKLKKILATWPGPITWLLPAKADVSKWLRGEHESVAIRVSAHPIVRQLCQEIDKPLISTSANVEGQTPAESIESIKKFFGSQIDFIVPGELGGLKKSTEIRDGLTGKIIR